MDIFNARNSRKNEYPGVFSIVIAVLFIITLYFNQTSMKLQWNSSTIISTSNLKRTVFLYFSSDSCSWCKRMEDETFSDEYIIKDIQWRYYPVKVNLSNTKKIIIDNIEYDVVKDILDKLEIKGIPAVVFYSKNLLDLGENPFYYHFTGFKSPISIQNEFAKEAQKKHKKKREKIQEKVN